MRTVYLGTSEFAAVVLERLADSPHRPALVVTRPDRPKGRGRRRRRRRWPTARAQLGLDVHPARAPQRARGARPDRRRRARGRVRVRVRRADQGAAAVGLRDAQRAPVAAAALARRRAGGARDHGRRRRRPGVSIMRVTEGLDAGPVCLQERRADPPRRRLRDARGAARAARRRAARARARRAPAVRRAGRARVTYADKIEAADRTLDPSRPPDELERTVRALRPHIGARRRAAGRRLPRRDRGARGGDRRARARARARATAAGSCWARPAARSS